MEAPWDLSNGNSDGRSGGSSDGSPDRSIYMGAFRIEVFRIGARAADENSGGGSLRRALIEIL